MVEEIVIVPLPVAVIARSDWVPAPLIVRLPPPIVMVEPLLFCVNAPEPELSESAVIVKLPVLAEKSIVTLLARVISLCALSVKLLLLAGAVIVFEIVRSPF